MAKKSKLEVLQDRRVGIQMEYEDRLADIDAQIRYETERRVKRDYGIKVGDTVESRFRDQQAFFRVEGVDMYAPNWTGKPWLLGVRKKKNGDYAQRVTKLRGDWATLPAPPITAKKKARGKA